MKLTTKGRYAVTAMVELAGQEGGQPLTLADIASRHGLSQSYLEQLFLKLRRGGLVRSVRGPGGGYVLAALPGAISVADIIRAVEEPIQATSCNSHDQQGCHQSDRCLTHQLWDRLGRIILDYLDSVSLGGLLESQGLAPGGSGGRRFTSGEACQTEASARGWEVGP